MNQFWKEMCIAGALGILLPGMVLGIAVRFLEDEPPVISASEPAEQEQIPREAVSISVLDHSGNVTKMELDEYLTGVVLAEMPASFEREALKAQAVVARTYAIRAQEKGTRHFQAAVCTDSECCQGYLSEADYEARGGTEESILRVREAVEATADAVLIYGGELIEATYFSCSGGSTEDAVAVWGTDVPYLQAVASLGEEDAAYYQDSVTFTAAEFAAALGQDLCGAPNTWFGSVRYTEGGGVDSMVIGGETYRGTTLRSLLGLRSTAFTVQVSGDSITFCTKGYGHRVGMSQYGADAMAAGGSTYEDILTYYYQGTELARWID